MMGNSKPSIQIDLNEFKLHLHLKNRAQRTFYFDSPSRKFYLCVIALVVNEMKKSGKIKSIPLLQHLDLLSLLNESIGGAAGSSDKENLLPRIYRKWKSALPNLEEAPLFKVLGKKKDEGDGAIGKVYSFTDAEKDDWANLFDYIGSDENVRLKFAIDKVRVSLEETSIIFGDLLNGDAWDRFVSSLKKEGEGKPEPVEEKTVPEQSLAPVSLAKKVKFTWLARNRWVVLIAVVVILAGAWGIWKAYLSPGKVASVDRMQYLPPDKPSIAVLPFVNLSEDPRQEYFNDGLTDTMITSLSRIPDLFVVASSSTFAYKGKSVKVQQVAEDLGIRYVLEGSIQRSEKRIRVRVQLIDAINGHHLWGESYDRKQEDIFALQDEITSKVITSLIGTFTSGESATAAAKSTKSLEALELYWLWRYHHVRQKKEDIILGRQYAESAIKIDPGYSAAWAALGLSLNVYMRHGLTSSREQYLKMMEECAEKALALNPSEPKAFQLLGQICEARREYDKAIEHAEKVVELTPNDPWVHWMLANAYRWAGKFEEAINSSRKGMSLLPYYPPNLLGSFGFSSFHLRRYEDALWAGEKFMDRFRRGETNDWVPPFLMVVIYSELGQEEKAREYAAEILKINSKWNFELMQKLFHYKNQSDLERLIVAGRRAGLK
jgi:adenylate cyclase